LADAGATVAINYRAGEREALHAQSLIRDSGGECVLCAFDVGDPEAVDRSVARLVSELGKIDVLVNNAGVSADNLLGRMKTEEWRSVLNTNLSGAFYCSRAVARGMVRNRWGRIVNIASASGELGNPGQANYSAAKAGLIGLTKSMARELAPRNVLVNAVSPGVISGGLSEKLTEERSEAIKAHVPLRRMGEPEDVAWATLFLCSGLADYITGEVLRVNGGLAM
jgi:3-oxoacyl-[acyl-carrier protein] reductase